MVGRGLRRQCVIECTASFHKMFFLVLFLTLQPGEDGKEFAREDLHLVVSQSDETDVVRDTAQDLEDAIWEGNELAV